MNQFAKRFAWFGFGLVAFAVFTATFAFSVSYKPYGVPDHRRDEYEQKVSEIRRRNEIRENLDQTARPVARVDQTEHDFGRVDPHATLSHSFRLTNAGGDPLEVAIRETSCKCTVGDLEQSLLLPGETTDVTLTWNTGYQADDYVQTAVLTTNDPLRKTIELSVRGTVRAELIAPISVGFPKTDLGGVARAKVTLFSQLWDGFEVVDVTSDLENLDWYAEPLPLSHSSLADKDPKSAWRVRLELPVVTSGEFSGTVTLKIQPASGAEAVTRTVDVSGKSRSPIAFLHPEISARGLDLGTMVTDKDHVHKLTVRVRGDRSRRIDVLDYEPKILDVDIEATDQEGMHVLTIRIPKGTEITDFSRADQHGYIQVGDPEDPSFENWFPLYGVVVNLPEG